MDADRFCSLLKASSMASALSVGRTSSGWLFLVLGPRRRCLATSWISLACQSLSLRFRSHDNGLLGQSSAFWSRSCLVGYCRWTSFTFSWSSVNAVDRLAARWPRQMSLNRSQLMPPSWLVICWMDLMSSSPWALVRSLRCGMAPQPMVILLSSGARLDAPLPLLESLPPMAGWILLSGCLDTIRWLR